MHLPRRSKDVSTSAIERQLTLLKNARPRTPTPARAAACPSGRPWRPAGRSWPRVPRRTCYGRSAHVAAIPRRPPSESRPQSINGRASSKHVTTAGAGEKTYESFTRCVSALHDKSPVVRNACAHLLGAYAQLRPSTRRLPLLVGESFTADSGGRRVEEGLPSHRQVARQGCFPLRTGRDGGVGRRLTTEPSAPGFLWKARGARAGRGRGALRRARAASS